MITYLVLSIFVDYVNYVSFLFDVNYGITDGINDDHFMVIIRSTCVSQHSTKVVHTVETKQTQNYALFLCF